MIVEEARDNLGHTLERTLQIAGGSPEPIPESQEEYNAQVDAAIRDLFPRIPNTDRQMIIEHAFRRVRSSKFSCTKQSIYSLRVPLSKARNR